MGGITLFDMTLKDQISLMNDLIEANPDVTILDFLRAKNRHMAKITPQEQTRREKVVKEWHARKSAWEISHLHNIPIIAIYDIADRYGYQFAGGRGKYLIDRDHKTVQEPKREPSTRVKAEYSNSGNWQLTQGL
jgi:hypothetical protein